MFWAFTFIIFGGLFLLKNVGVISDINFDVIWPIALVVLGLFMIFKKKSCLWWHRCGGTCGKNGK